MKANSTPPAAAALLALLLLAAAALGQAALQPSSAPPPRGPATRPAVHTRPATRPAESLPPRWSWVETYLRKSTYPVVSLWLLAGGFGVPCPEDIPLILAGWACQRGWGHIWIMVPLCFICVLGADCVLYYLGWRYGHHVPRLPLLRHYLTPVRLAKAERRFQYHGGKTLFTARFLPGLRTPLFFTAGVFKIPFWKLLVFDGGAALATVPTLVILGYLFPFSAVAKSSHWAQLGIVALLAAAVVLAVLWHRFIKKREQAEEQRAAASTEAPKDAR